MTGMASSADAPTGALSPQEWRALKLTEKEKLTHNTYRFRFEFPDKSQTAGLSVASCLLTKAMIQSPGDEKPKAVIRPYTPTSAPDAQGYMDLVIKVYPQGKMSKYFGDMKVGQTMDFKGPLPKYPYQPNAKKQIGMVAGGTGITPMLQVVDAILANPADNTQVTLVYANVSESDIILKDKIDALAAKHPNFKVYYLIDKVGSSSKWTQGVGYVTASLLAKTMPPPSDDSLVMVCGPPGMMAAVSGDKAPDKSQGPLTGLLKQLGYSEQQVYKF